MSIVVGLIIGFVIAYTIGMLYWLRIVKKELVCYDESLRDLNESEKILKLTLERLDSASEHLKTVDEYVDNVINKKQD